MILIDSTIPMYLIGAAHPHKHDARRLLEQLVSDSEPLVTDTEVLQEILHRYTAIGRREAIEPAFNVLRGVVDVVLPIDETIVDRAKTLVLSHLTISARDAIHAAVMQAHGIERILSFDQDFDRIPGITRVCK